MRAPDCPGPIERLAVYEGERRVDGLFLEHYFRYRFAEQFVRDAAVLDCACGTGYGTCMLGRKAREVVGVDNSPEALRIAAANWFGPRIRYLPLEIDELASLQRQFDVIVSFETIEHLADPEGFLVKVWDRLRAGGCFIVSTPNRDAYRVGLEPNPYHRREFSPPEFLSLLSKRFSRIEMFAQMAPEPASRPAASNTSSFFSRLRMTCGAWLARRPFGYSLYLRWMRQRFSVVRASDYRNHCFVIAVCRKDGQ